MALIRFYKPTLRRKDMDAVLQTMVDEKIGPGERKKEFVAQFSAYIPSAKGGYALRTYPDAIKFSLLALKLEIGDKIAVSILSPMLYKTVIESLGYKLYLCDIDPETGCMSMDEATKAVEEGVKAFLLHEPFGQLPINLTDLPSFNLPIVEDITESFGSKLGETRCGELGTLVISAFEEDGVVSTGGGAIVISRKDAYWDNLKSVYKPYKTFSELPDMNAALGLIQIANLEMNMKRRFELYILFKNAILRGKHHIFGIENIDFESNGYMFSVVVESKVEDVIAFANKYSISCKKSFSSSIGSLYSDKYERFPNALPAINRAIAFPLYPFLQQKEQDSIAKVLSHLP